jgi:GntR family transcriptional regulator, negative regulator for fad regulon and positive regulator of fabA
MNKVAKQLEHHFVKSILQGHYKLGETLIAETFLALELNVNRCSLRTVLKVLEKDGWVAIKHGQPTIVNDFISSCTLNAAIKRVKIVNDDYCKQIKADACESLLDILEILVSSDKDVVQVLEGQLPLSRNIDDFIAFEVWLGKLVSARTNNMVYKLLLNKLIPLYQISVVVLSEVEERLSKHI